jgi:hypothetical protein
MSSSSPAFSPWFVVPISCCPSPLASSLVTVDNCSRSGGSVLDTAGCKPYAVSLVPFFHRLRPLEHDQPSDGNGEQNLALFDNRQPAVLGHAHGSVAPNRRNTYIRVKDWNEGPQQPHIPFSSITHHSFRSLLSNDDVVLQKPLRRTPRRHSHRCHRLLGRAHETRAAGQRLHM